jgi:signal transduction histidine kinase/CheY-like chemotaxis protein
LEATLHLIDDRTGERAASPLELVLLEGEIVHAAAPLTLLDAQGNRVAISYTAAPIRDGRAKTIGAVLVVRNETDRRDWEQAQLEADQRKDEFLATLAHELRNPLSPIRTGIELLKLSSDDPQVLVDVSDMMERQTRHLVRLVDDLLDVSRITRGKLELRRDVVLLGDVVREAVERVRPLIEQSEHSLELALPTAPLRLHADASRLTQVFANLLDNAAKYTPRGGRIRISAESVDGYVKVTVADNGIGIPTNRLDAVFDLYSQISGAKLNGHSGLGIGLTLVKRLVEMHGGTVTADSDGSSGSRFTIQLPLLEQAEVAKPKQLPAEPCQLPSRRILIADDNHDALETLCRLVKLMGHEVRGASDGESALEAGRLFLPEIVLLDLGMPRLNGLEAARRLRAEPWGAETYLVAVTGWGQREDRRRTQEAGFDEHLVKPVELAQLQSLLQRLASRELATDIATEAI